MKIMTLIPPRTDGTVIARYGKKQHTFSPDGAGNLTCDVDDATHAEAMLQMPDKYRRLPTAAEEAKAREDAEQKAAEERALREQEEAEKKAKKK